MKAWNVFVGGGGRLLLFVLDDDALLLLLLLLRTDMDPWMDMARHTISVAYGKSIIISRTRSGRLLLLLIVYSFTGAVLFVVRCVVCCRSIHGLGGGGLLKNPHTKIAFELIQQV